MTKGGGEAHGNLARGAPQEGAPLVLDTLGANLWTGGHFDRYVATFYDYKEGNLSPQVFEPPDICVEGPDSAEGTERASLLSQWHVMLPNPHYGRRPPRSPDPHNPHLPPPPPNFLPLAYLRLYMPVLPQACVLPYMLTADLSVLPSVLCPLCSAECSAEGSAVQSILRAPTECALRS